ncbi:MAG: cytidylate kinase family protein [Deltaproteobacteria bacterium]|nr:cytidylate kinase family protein [Deltaproteobacteria bacterium]
MSVLILSSENEELENQIAQKTAERLGYTTLDQQFYNEIAKKYTLDSKKLMDAMIITPSFLKRMPSKQWYYYLSCVEVEVLARLLEDNCVCWGLAAHLYVAVISHVLKVRLIGGHSLMSSGQGNMDEGKIKKIIAEQERSRENWSMTAYNRKEADPGLYDMVINLDQVQPDEAVDTLSTTMGYPRLKAMTYSKNNLADRALAARVKNVLLKSLTDIQVDAQNGTVVVTTASVKREKSKKIDTIKKIAAQVEGIGYLEVHWNKDMLTEAAMSYR